MRFRPLPGAALSAVLATALAAVAAQAAESVLELDIAGESIGVLPLERMHAELPVHELDFIDPLHDKRKRYRAFAIRDVLEVGFGSRWRSDQYTNIVFTALDGYQSVSTRDRLLEPGGYLVFEDLDVAAGWEPIGRRRADPGPFYLVWTGAGQTTANEYPWPWQVAGVSILQFEQAYPEVFPAGAPAGSSVLAGYEIFKSRCVRCHAVNGQGGKVGPDLNAPQSIVEYRSAHMIREFIRHPSRYRHTQMPDHTDLDRTDLDGLLDYFWYKSRHRM